MTNATLPQLTDFVKGSSNLLKPLTPSPLAGFFLFLGAFYVSMSKQTSEKRSEMYKALGSDYVDTTLHSSENALFDKFKTLAQTFGVSFDNPVFKERTREEIVRIVLKAAVNTLESNNVISYMGRLYIVLCETPPLEMFGMDFSAPDNKDVLDDFELWSDQNMSLDSGWSEAECETIDQLPLYGMLPCFSVFQHTIIRIV